MPNAITGMSNHLKFGRDLQISAAGMNVERRRQKMIAENIANQNATPTRPDVNPYRGKIPVVATRYDPVLGVDLVQVVSVKLDPRDFPRIYQPGHPGADAQGFVKKANVDAITATSELQESQASYQANLQAYANTRQMMEKTLSLLESR